MKAVHAKLLMATGVIHSFPIGIPLYWEKWKEIASRGFLNAAPHRIDFERPIHEGLLDIQAEAAIWFFIGGVALFVLGHLVHAFEVQVGRLPRFLGWELLGISLAFWWMIPISGFPVFLLPQAVFMILRQAREPVTA